MYGKGYKVNPFSSKGSHLEYTSFQVSATRASDFYICHAQWGYISDWLDFFS